MQSFYRLSLLLLCVMGALSLNAQRIVPIAGSGNPNNPTNITPIIRGDTMSNGSRVDNNTIYTLENGVTYVVSGTLSNTPEWALQIQAADLDNTDSKPRLTRLPNASGDFPNVFWPEGDLTIRNVWVISGERGPGAQHDWGRVRLLGENSRVIVENCIFEKERGGFLQVRANGIKMYVSNTIFRNGGNRKILQGNGRGIDARNFAFDTLIVTQSVFHNLQDRVFRSQGASDPHNYIEFDHNTVFNHVGRHGCFQFGRALTVKFTNNVLSNPIMMGTSPIYTDEQTQPDNESHKVFTIDTLYDNTSLTFAANNVFYTQDVLDYFASNDTVSQPEVYSQLIAESLGADAPNTFISEVVEFEAVPMTILEYVQDLYADPSAEDMFDFIVEDISLAGTPLDFGNLFDFSTFSPCYSEDAVSASASTQGGAIGAVDFCADLSVSSIYEPTIAQFKLQVAPNPVNGVAVINYEMPTTGPVRLSILDMMGREVAILDQAERALGNNQLTWMPSGNLSAGFYILRLQTTSGQQAIKIMLD